MTTSTNGVRVRAGLSVCLTNGSKRECSDKLHNYSIKIYIIIFVKLHLMMLVAHKWHILPLRQVLYKVMILFWSMFINWPWATGCLKILSGAVKSPVKDTFPNIKLKTNFALQISHAATERGNISTCGLEAHGLMGVLWLKSDSSVQGFWFMLWTTYASKFWKSNRNTATVSSINKSPHKMKLFRINCTVIFI